MLTRLGDFELLRPIGHGAAGDVYEAWQVSLRRTVAVKVLHSLATASAEQRERFRIEAEAAAATAHEGIVAVHAVGEQDGVAYIVQELVEGGRTLETFIEDARRAGDTAPGYYREAAQIVARVAEALAAAHERGIVHRDVKPGNVLITPAGVPKVTDFGIARLDGGPELSRTGDFLGTPYYASPEQFEARRDGVDARSDVFSLGVTLYELLTLVRPFPGDTYGQVLRRILNEVPVDPRRIRSKVPRDLAVIAGKALEKNPARRYANMGEFAADLRRFLDDEPILARPMGTIRRGWRWARRHPGRSVAIVLGSTGVAVVLVLLGRIVQQAERARLEATTADQAVEFVTGIFASADPDVSGGRAIPVGDLIDEAAEAMRSGDIASEPLLRQRLLFVFGKIYVYLDDGGHALPLLEESAELAETYLDPEDPRRVLALEMVGNALQLQRRLDEAEVIQRRVLEEQRRLHGECSQQSLIAMLNLGTTLLRMGRASDADPLFTAARDGLLDLCGPNDRDACAASANLGVLRIQQGRLDAAHDLLRAAYEGSRDALGAGSTTALQALMGLAQVALLRKDLGEAEKLAREAYEGQCRVSSPSHPRALVQLSTVASIHRDQGRLDEASDEFRAIVAARETVLGDSHQDTLLARNNLGYTALLASDYDLAESELSKAWAALETADPDGAGTAYAGVRHFLANNLASTFLKRDRFAEALPLAEQSLAYRYKALGPAHEWTLLAIENVVAALARLGRRDEARSRIDELDREVPAGSAASSRLAAIRTNISS